MFRSWPWAFAILFCVGCKDEEPEKRLTITESREFLYERVEDHFAKAIYLKPKDIEGASFDPYLAPLILQEIAANDTNGGVKRFGTIVQREDGRWDVDLARPAVYYTTSSFAWRDRSYLQYHFLWCHGRDRETGEWTFQGVRQTLDARGFPAIWEVLTDTLGVRALYVSERLEAAAREAHGNPLPDRRFALETDIEQHPRIIVARTFPEAAAPLGPYLYLRARSTDVSTLICRCMPSQVDETTQTIEYDMIPLNDLQQRGFGELHWDATPGPPLGEMVRLPDELLPSAASPSRAPRDG